MNFKLSLVANYLPQALKNLLYLARISTSSLILLPVKVTKKPVRPRGKELDVLEYQELKLKSKIVFAGF